MRLLLKRYNTNIYLATLYALFVALLLLWLTRFGFAWYNNDNVGAPSFWRVLQLSMHGLRYDLTALVYFNIVFIAMRILPFGFVYNAVWLRVSDWVYGICNGLMLAINIGDIPYYRFTGARLRWANILNITTDSEIGNIVAQYAGSYWWAFLAGAAFIAVLVVLYGLVGVSKPQQPQAWYTRTGIFVLCAGLCAVGMRGRVGSGVPLSISDAAFAVRTSPEINVVLNSPFCILRSLNVKKSNFEKEQIYYRPEELAALRSSVHTGAPAGTIQRRNIVTIIIESGGAEWIDNLTIARPDSARGLMPFVDSLSRVGTVFEHVIACSRLSAGGATAIMCGFPAFEPFFFMLSPYNKNVLDSPARLLRERGWKSVFYYGCKHGSFNIDQTAFASGYSKIVDRDAYGNDDDYDGMWGIFDYPMAEYAVRDIGTLGQPFIATWFTISAHGPFTIPEGWDTSSYRHKEVSPERGLEYTDRAIRRFFELARTQPWYDNTTFFITADHGNRDFKGTVYDNDYIRNHIPLIIYAPDGSVPQARIADRVLSQHDIAPLLLSAVSYDEPYVALGTDAAATDFDGYGIVRTDGGRYFIVGPAISIYAPADLSAVEEVYNTASDPTMTRPANDYDATEADRMLQWARAFMQDYTTRLNADRMTIAKE